MNETLTDKPQYVLVAMLKGVNEDITELIRLDKYFLTRSHILYLTNEKARLEYELERRRKELLEA